MYLVATRVGGRHGGVGAASWRNRCARHQVVVEPVGRRQGRQLQLELVVEHEERENEAAVHVGATWPKGLRPWT